MEASAARNRDNGKNTYRELKTLLTSFFGEVASKMQYWLPVTLISILSYGFSMFNRTVSIDDLARSHYHGGDHAMLRATRWGMDFWNKLFSTTNAYTPFVDKFFAVLLFLLAAFLLSALLYSLNGRKQYVWQYTVFSCCLISYPLINEIWEYNGANMVVCGNFVLAAITLLIETQENAFSWKTILICGLLMAPVMSSYESGVFAYITLVFIVLYLKYCVYSDEKQKFLTWFLEGLRYALPLVAALILRILIGYALITAFGLSYETNGETDIMWGTGSFFGILMNVIYDTCYTYFIKGLAYPPLLLFSCSVLAFGVYSLLLCLRKREILPIILCFALGGSLFFQSFLQGIVMPHRTAHTIQIFVPFVCYLILTPVSNQTNRKGQARRVLTVILMFVCLRQGIYLHTLLALNNQRSDNEAAIAQQIGMRIFSEFDSGKPVVFVGTMDLGADITSQVHASEPLALKIVNGIRNMLGKSAYTENNYRIVETNTNSVLNWNKLAFGSQIMMERYLSYYGFNINILDHMTREEYNKYTQIAESNNMKPYEIRDMGDCLLVCFG